ncbi:MAG: NAD-dependent deacylase [Acidobacteriaceae bacterium]|nr:NAD-dependent deacylase [Acidobacteriaceae bacterium]
MPLRQANPSFTGSESIVVLTGAGISRESGLDTFRDRDGIWANVNIEDVATPAAFRRNPALVHSFYNARRRQLLSPAVRPNAAHTALTELQRSWSGDVLVVTQNIDDLHERGGTTDVIHMHGELLSVRCCSCNHRNGCTDDLSAATTCLSCGSRRKMRPDVVWFGEMPMHMDRIERALERADLFISVGTSGNVYPAAGFVEMVRSAGAHTVELNVEKSLGASLFHEAVYGPATRVVTQYVNLLLTRASQRNTPL